jgi:hypothetical protein
MRGINVPKRVTHTDHCDFFYTKKLPDMSPKKFPKKPLWDVYRPGCSPSAIENVFKLCVYKKIDTIPQIFISNFKNMCTEEWKAICTNFENEIFDRTWELNKKSRHLLTDQSSQGMEFGFL